MAGPKPIRHEGRIKVWNDDRGFGFIDAGRGHEVFVHIRDFNGLIGRPEQGQTVRFELGFDRQRRRCAINVELLSRLSRVQKERKVNAHRPRVWRILLAGIALSAGVFLMTRQHLPWQASLLSAICCPASFLTYRSDKAAAGRGDFRCPEDLLHLLDAAGGWPGGLLAQGIYSHKTRKRAFQIKFWLTVAANLAVVIAFKHAPPIKW